MQHQGREKFVITMNFLMLGMKIVEFCTMHGYKKWALNSS